MEHRFHVPQISEPKMGERLMRQCSSFYYSAPTNKLGISLVRVGVRGIMLPLLKYVFVHMLLEATMSLNVKKKENIVSRGWGGG